MSSPTLHIHAPKTSYIGQVRKKGFKLWKTVTPSMTSSESALRRLATKLGNYDYGRIVMSQEFYDPVVVWELKKP